jgi:hypothetical protein
MPNITWYTGVSATSRKRREIESKWSKFKPRYKDSASPLPRGWTRHICPGLPDDCRERLHPPPQGFGSHYYTHVSWTSVEFWYHIPLPNPRQVPTIRESTRFLFGKVEKAWLRTDGVKIVSSTQCVSLTDNSGQWVGVLRLHEHTDISPNEMSKMQKTELVAISRGRARNSRPEEPGLEE